MQVIPLRPRSKKPVGDEWQNWRLTVDEIDLAFSDSQNIGVLLGEPSHGLVDVDLDCDAAVALAPVFLPPTPATFGRTSRRASHRLYRCDPPPPATRKLQYAVDGQRATLVEVRSTGSQTVFPGSTHPSGEPIEWDETGEPSVVDADVLLAAARRLAAASLLVKFWPLGARHDAALALSGGLLRSGWSTAAVSSVVGAVARAAGDDELEDRVRAVEDTAATIVRGDPATGWITLGEIVGERVARKAMNWLGDAPPSQPPADAPRTEPEQPTAALTLAAVLDDLEAYLTRYVRFTMPAQAVVCALWALLTHCYDQFDQSPILIVSSAVMRSGKSRLFDALEQVVARPWRAVRPSEAVLFREIEAGRPTLMLDEYDTIFSERSAGLYEGLRAMLNAGNRKGTTVPRVVGQGSKMEVRRFSIFGPKCMAGIGNAPSTVTDRAVVIRLKRRARSESVERFRLRTASAEAAPLREALARLDLHLEDARPQIPDTLDDRAADSWEPLLALADAAGGSWPERARAAATALSQTGEPEDEGLGVQLLADVRAIFAEHTGNQIATADLIGRLGVIEQSPWGDFDHGRPISTHRIAALLRPFEVRPRQLRIGDKTMKGYLRESFADAFSRYLPVVDP
jgi:hypothetical protein